MTEPNKPHGNVVELIPSKLRERLGAFKASSSLSDFLRVLDVLATSKVEVPEVWDTWGEFKGRPDAQGAARSVLDWTSTLHFHYSEYDQNPSEESSAEEAFREQIQYDSATAHHAVEAGLHQEEIRQYIYERLKDPAYRYGNFAGALPFERFLPEYPHLEEAARIIAQYLTAAMGDSPFDSADEGPLGPPCEPQNTVVHPGLKHFIDGELIPWAFDAERHYWLSQSDHSRAAYHLAQIEQLEAVRPYLLGAIDLREPESFPTGFSLATLAKAIPYLRQSEIAGIVAELEFGEMRHEIDLLELKGIAELVGVLLSLPLSKAFGSWNEYEEAVPVHSVLRTYAKQIVYVSDLPYLPLELFIEAVFGLSMESWSTDLISALQLPNEEYSATRSRLRALIGTKIDQLTRLRRADFKGKVPVTREDAEKLGLGIYGMCDALEFTPRHDISYLIATGAFGEGFGSCSVLALAQGQEDRFGRARSTSLLLIVDAALDEGWDEFATAVLAFYLFTQPSIFDGQLHMDWHKLGQTLRRATDLPGWERARHAAAIAKNTMRDQGKADSLDFLCVSAWACRTPDASDVAPEIPERVLTLQQIINELIEQIGKEAWLKLSYQGKRQLQDAESLWSSMHMKLGRGSGDFGLVATAYVKVFEGEILERLRPLTVSQPFIAYYEKTYRQNPERHIHLGSLLYLLKNFEHLPTDLKNAIVATHVRLQQDKGLVDDLFRSMQYRNKGAHAGPFNEKQFLELRKLVFEAKSLKRFIELL